MQSIGSSTRWSLFVPIVFSAILFVLSAIALVYEVAPFSLQNASALARFTTLERGGETRALSTYSQWFLLNDCLEAIAGPVGMAQPSGRRVSMLKNCQSLAEKAANSNPTFALAWYIAAYASAELKQYDLFNFQLAAAQKTAPNEQWLATLRVALAEDNLDRLDTEARAGNDADLKLLVQSRLGVASIASRYVAQTNFRERITLIVETLSNEEQRRFVNYVRAAARRSPVKGQAANEPQRHLDQSVRATQWSR